LTEKSTRDGLYDKYEVYKDGEAVPNSFVLNPESDPAAREALIRYAEATDDQKLAEDLLEWMTDLSTREDTNVDQPASERLTVAELLSHCGSATHNSNETTFGDAIKALREAHPAVAGHLVTLLRRSIDESGGSDSGTASGSEHPEWHRAVERALNNSHKEGYDAK
jgi:hypothetical protein